MSPDKVLYETLGVMTRALGATVGRMEGYRNSFVASLDTQAACDHAVICGWMIERRPGAGALTYQVTEAGKSRVREALLEKALDELVQDRISAISTMMASELVGPNSHEYDGLVQQYEESSKVDASARKFLLSDVFSLAMQQRSVMISMYSTIAKSLEAPDTTVHHEAIKAKLREMQKQIAAADRWLGGNTTRDCMLVEQDTPELLNETQVSSTDAAPHWAVFEIYPAQDLAWTNAVSSFVRHKEKAGRFIECMPLPDGRLGVLNSICGPALFEVASQRLEKFKEGLILPVHSEGWPDKKVCFAALDEHFGDADIEAIVDDESSSN